MGWHDTGSGPGVEIPEPPKWSGLVGKTFKLAESDYRFGVGDLTLTVTAVLHEQEMADGTWIYVRGDELYTDGRVRQSRQVLIRQSRTRA